jgi:hypothetical protein
MEGLEDTRMISRSCDGMIGAIVLATISSLKQVHHIRIDG